MQENLAQNLKKMENKRIFCTGGAGSIGGELVRQLAPHNTVVILDNNETALFDLVEELNQKGFIVYGHVGDVRDKTVFEKMKTKFGFPEIIFHCASLKHLTTSAWNPEEYVTTNILGTLNVLDFIGEKPIKLVNISTDKTVNASSIMGATKKVAEIAVKNAGHISVRFGNVLGSRGSVVSIWQRQIEHGESLTVTDEKMTRYMMTIPEAVKLVIQAAEIGEPGQIFILDMGKPVNVLNLALEILSKSGKDVGIKMIGMRPGEILSEKLMTEEEEARAIKRGDNFWIL